MRNLYPLLSFLLISLVLSFQVSCDTDPQAPEPPKEPQDIIILKADFRWGGDTIAPAHVELMNASELATSYEWDFGDGSQSREDEPQHSYLWPGQYTIRLIATGPDGIDTITKVLTVQSSPFTPIIDEMEGLYKGTVIHHEKVYYSSPQPTDCDSLSPSFCHYFDTLYNVEFSVYRTEYDSLIVVGARDLPIGGSLCYYKKTGTMSEPIYKFNNKQSGTNVEEITISFYSAENRISISSSRGRINTNSYRSSLREKIGGLDSIPEALSQRIEFVPNEAFEYCCD